MAVECDSFHIAVLMNQVEYKKSKKLQNISNKMPFNVCSLLLKNYISKSGLPRMQLTPVIVIKINHNCTKAHSLPPMLQYVSYI